MFVYDLVSQKGVNFMPERMMNHEIIESVGIEMEFSNLDRKSNKLQQSLHNKDLRNYKLVHDASCESMREFFADTDLPIEFVEENGLKTLAPIVRRAVIGGEVVSPIRHSGHEDWIKEIYDLVEILQTFGEDESSERDSFHVHVNVSQSIPLFAVQNLLRITFILEAILFRLGGMGRINRGVTNNYCFCRPFLGKGPPVIQQKWGNGKVSNIPICDPMKMLNAESKEKFFEYFGDSLYFAQHNVRYVTQRYMCVNFFPILTQGSFEFRTANKTLNPEYIIAWTNLCKAIVDKSFTCKDIESYEKVYRPLHENREIPIDEFINALSYYPKLDEDTIDVLTDIWRKSPTPMFDNEWRYTHLKEPTRYNNPKNAPKSLGDEEILDATFIDIHQLQQDNEEINRELRLGEGLGFFPGGMPRIREERPRRRQPEIRIGEDATSDLHEIAIHRMQTDYICRWDAELFDISLVKNNEGLVTIIVYNRDIEEEEVRVLPNLNWFSLRRIIDDLFDGNHLEDCRYE